MVKALILEALSEQIQDCANGYNSLLVIYKKTVSENDLKLVEAFCASRKRNTKITHGNIWEVPVCYHDSFGIDLQTLATVKKMEVETLVQLHSSVTYTVFCKGFLPGFMYLGGLDKRLFIDRKAVPLLKVPQNSVAIGGKQTGVYPTESPGGWHIIGRTPAILFDVSKKIASKISMGDTMKFKPITLTDYIKMDRVNDKTKLITQIG